ncbi:MAG: YeeE/YedE family protein [bacterium]|nr:YeeE/YedE family protein [bacterium]
MEVLQAILFPEVGTAWPWYIGGPLIGLVVPALLYFGNKHFGVSSSLRHLCRAVLPEKMRAGVPYFQYSLSENSWNLVFVFGMLAGGWLGANLLGTPETLTITQGTSQALAAYGISGAGGLAPIEIFSVDGLFTLPGFILIVVGGFLVGFGTRYANGCTSGHAIMGLSLLSPTSLIATASFFIGGILMTYFGFPLIFGSQ